MKNLIALGIISSIVENLSERNDFNTKKDGILELNCGAGELALALNNAGLTRYHGVSRSPDLIAEAKKNVLGYTKKFHVGNTSSSEEILQHPHDVIISAQGECPYDAIPSGNRLIVVTRGAESWSSCCLSLAPYFAAGASTVQHGNLYLTIGVRS